MYDVKGKRARQKLAKRRLDMIDCNIGSYSRLLNDPKRLKSLKDFHELTAAVATISADADAEKERRQVQAKKKASEKAVKKREEEEKEAEKKARLLPNAIMALYEFDGVDHTD
jgi:hypothetical protein